MSSWRVQARSSHLTVSAGPAGLEILEWCPDVAPPPVPERGRPTPFVPDPDKTMAAYPALGSRLLAGCDLVSRVGDVRGTGLELVEVTGDDRHVRARHLDGTGTLQVVTHLTADPAHDVLSARAVLTNVGDVEVVLEHVASGSWYTPAAGDVTVSYLAGAWGQEYTPSTTTMGAGRFSIGSRAGITSHAFQPWVSVGEPRGAGQSGITRSVALAWCGSWELEIERPFGESWARISAGVADEVILAPGESFQTPVSYGLCCEGDPSGRWQEFGRSLGRGLDPYHHPVVHNSWYATGFDVDVEQQIALARRAAELGVEVFVMDDGWFRGRDSDRAGLGDWTADPTTFPDGLDPLIEAVAALGMRFGIWVEPEGVNPDSDLFRAHPEWAYEVPGRQRFSARSQYVLDFGRRDVVEWTKGWLRDLLGNHDITFLKWDMNRVITDTGSRGGDWALRHAEGYLEVMDMVRAEFPQVTVEACSGGGGRVDWSVLPRCDLVWASDETGPRDRLAIQHGFSRAYPASVLSSWVTDMDDVRDRAPASLEFRCLVAMCGVLGIGVDLSRAGDETMATLAAMVARYLPIRATVLAGRQSWVGQPADEACAVVYEDDDLSVVFAFRRDVGADLEVPTSRGPVSPTWSLADDCDLVVLS